MVLRVALQPLMIASHGGAVEGGVVSMRAISGRGKIPWRYRRFIQVDGVAGGKSSVRRMADFDIDQIEVLKGPQALFYGKNSPAGIMTIRTADPTKTLAGKVSVNYETQAGEWRTAVFVAGPLSDTLRLRVASIFSDMKGWLRTLRPPLPLSAWSPSRAPNQTHWGIRATLTVKATRCFASYGRRILSVSCRG